MSKAIQELRQTIARLRAPGGCPWDREQTHLSLRKYLLEETYEALDALDAGDIYGMREEFGDLLFVVANLARHLKIDPEAALRAANAKFTRRFSKIETALAAEGRRPEDSTLAEMDALKEKVQKFPE